MVVPGMFMGMPPGPRPGIPGDRNAPNGSALAAAAAAAAATAAAIRFASGSFSISGLRLL